MKQIIELLSGEREKDMLESMTKVLENRSDYSIENIEAEPKNKKTRVCIVEEQEILRHAYGAALPSQSSIELVGLSGNSSTDSILDMIRTLQPATLVLGTKVLQDRTIDQLDRIRQEFPDLGLIVLATLFDDQGTKRLKEFTKINPRGCAFLLKHSIDRASQLAQVVQSVTEGQVILDSFVMERLIEARDLKFSLLKDLTHRELEVVSWMAKGYRNETISDVLGVDRKTVERHINCIYSKLQNILTDARQPRVSTAILYLKATGQLPEFEVRGD
ncbi:MAG: response regulator transcription factor [Chloroflexi bacterium]|jgi:DNA-binding NarL/FixJ family response regulator|nr:response regulator transcription factor [Chloroflexota bacterium]